ncbi:MAG: pimeloyl-ACP methyl ester carboxylesterase [Limisphaerales bacterium]|jgi:pimeloyl-ACP methyl ester carboxylesterase
MIKKIAIAVVLLLIVGSIGTYFSYANFKSNTLLELTQNSAIANTPLGPIEYRLSGDSGPVLLFLHGTPGGYDQSVKVESVRVLTPSRPGYLRTKLDIGSSPADQAKSYAALLDALEIDKVVVMGASGGGPSSISFAAMYPERTRALIAMEAVSQNMELGGDKTAMPFFMQSDFLLWATLSLVDTFMGPEGIVGLLIPDPKIQKMILEDPTKLSSMQGLLWSAWPISQRSIGQQNDFEQFSKIGLPSNTITVPTLIIHGTADVNVPYDQSKILATQIAGAILHTIDGGDHMMPFSHAEEVNRAVDTFLEGIL